MNVTRTIVLFAFGYIGAVSLCPAAEQADANKPADTAAPTVLLDQSTTGFHDEFSGAMRRTAELHRQNDEMAAAAELRKAEKWLDQASKQASEPAKDALKAAAAEFYGLAAAIESGDLVAAETLYRSMAKANQALAQWHYFKARRLLGEQDEQTAAQHLQVAADYLRDAAESIHFSYRSDTVDLLDNLDKDKKVGAEETVIVPSHLKERMAALESAIREMGDALGK